MKTASHPLIERAEAVRMSSAAIQAFGRDLPTNREVLDDLLERSVEGYFGRAFTVLALSAVERGIPLKARHLVEGTRLFPDPGITGKIALQTEGDVVGALASACEDGRLSWEREAVALFLAAHLSKKTGDERHRKRLVRRARMLIRVSTGRETHLFVSAAADILEDEELDQLIPARHSEELTRLRALWVERFLDHIEGATLADIDEEDTYVPHITRRRAVERIGRNEPCPCGSGKKYKRCCLIKDSERLQDSSDIAGVTRAELRQNLEEHLTLERIEELRAYELARLDMTRVARELVGPVFLRLIAFQEFDALRDMFTSLPPAEIEPHFSDAVDDALRVGKADKARAFIESLPEKKTEWLGFLPRCLANGIESSEALDLLEEELAPRVDEAAIDVARDLMRSRWPSLGIVLARGMAPLATWWDKYPLLEELGLTRDRLDLPAVDPTEVFQDLWDWEDEEEDDFFERMPPQLESKTTKANATTGKRPNEDADRMALKEKEAELTRLREELNRLRTRLEEIEAEKTTLEPSDEVESPRVKELRKRVDHLRGELSARHMERNQLRRKLEQTLKHVDALEAARERGEPTDVVPADDVDEDEGEETPASLSFRVPVFSKRFRDRAQSVPEPVKRRAVITASRIAAGDENAFRGTKRLKLDRSLYRQRVGRDYRLIFRMEGDDELLALELVARKDLDRAVRELARDGTAR